jgi:epoxyqueuosine reductase
MGYLATERARARRLDPRQILPECRCILVLAVPYSPPRELDAAASQQGTRGRIAAYACGDDYHEVLPPRLESLVHFIEAQAGHPVANRWYTDTGPILERDLAMRAGLGWIGKNTCLIHPRHGSYFLLAEILLELELEPDPPFATDRCGSCTRCIQACPTDCILPDRTLDAGRCISYLTIELKEDVPLELRARVGDWVFGCDVCQAVCPWNRFAEPNGDPAFQGDDESQHPLLNRETELSTERFNRKFKNSPVRRTKRRGYLRNAAIALGNRGTAIDLPVLQRLAEDAQPLVQRHASWALEQVRTRLGKGEGRAPASEHGK